MTNFEFYLDEIKKFGLRSFASSKKTGKLGSCYLINCNDCRFHEEGSSICGGNVLSWLLEEHEEPEVDWSKVPVDTPIYVSENGKVWYPRYFAKYENDHVCAWPNGTTSFSLISRGCVTWTYAKLANKEEEKHEER